MSFYKNGIVTTPKLSNGDINPYDTAIYIEPDNTGWVRIIHHNNPTSNKFASTDSFTTSVYRSADMWFNGSILNLNTSGKWELMIKQATTSTATETKYRFIQTNNPMTATYAQTTHANVTINTTSGYSTNSSYGGIYYNGGSNAYLVTNNANSGNWYGALGCWTAYGGGIPGIFGATITTGYIDVYYRIDDTLAKTYVPQLLSIYPTGDEVLATSDGNDIILSNSQSLYATGGGLGKILANDFIEY